MPEKTIVLILSVTLAATLAEAVLPLREQWRAACAALAGGEGGKAERLFGEFTHWYSKEPEAGKPEFRERLLRYHAMAALSAGNEAAALPLLEEWFRHPPEAPAYKAFLRYQQAAAYGAVGKPERMTATWNLFLREHSRLPEAILVRWHLANHAIAAEDFAEASRHFEALLQHEALSPGAAAVARCAFATLRLRSASPGDSLRLLRGQTHSPLLPAWRAVLAPTLVSQLLEKGRMEKARTASAWLRPGEETARKLSELLPPPTSSPAAFRTSLWRQHWRRQLAALCGGLREEERAIPPVDQLYALRLRALASSGSTQDAVILAGAVLEAPEIRQELRALAFATAVKAYQSLAEWQRAEDLSRRFLEEFPEDPALPRILFLNARTAVLQSRHAAALDQLHPLLEAYPNHPDQKRWQLEVASCYLQTGKPVAALRQLRLLAEKAPPSWSALLRFKEGRCLATLGRKTEALAAFRSVSGQAGATPALQETALLERMKLSREDPERFLSLVERHRAAFPEGRHVGLAWNLAGGFHLSRGEYGAAETAYLTAIGTGGGQADFAREKLAIVYQKSGDNVALGSHLTAWLEHATNEKTVPKALCQQLRASFRATVANPAIPAFLKELYRGYLRNETAVPIPAFFNLLAHGWPHLRGSFGTSRSFSSWLQTQAARADAFPALLLSLYRADLLEKDGRTDSADALRLRMLSAVPGKPLPAGAAFALARAAASYHFPESRDRLENFLRKHPQSPDVAEGMFLLAEIHLRDGKEKSARPLLRKIHRRFPDAGVWAEAGERLAAILQADKRPGEASAVATRLLENPHLAPNRAASLLLRKAQADAARGRPQLAAVDCQRVLVLYAAYPEIRKKAVALLRETARELGPEKAGAVRDFLRQPGIREKEAA